MGFFFLRSDYADVAYRTVQTELHLDRNDDFFSRTLTGAFQGAHITIRGDRTGHVEEVVVRAQKNAPRNLFLFPADGSSESAVPTFDPGFDRKVHVSGSRLRVAAMFDEMTREAIASVVWKHHAVFTNGAFMLDAVASATVNGGPLVGEIDGRRFARFLRRVVKLGQRLADRAHAPVCDLLLANVEADPRTDVRQHNLALLIDRYPEAWETRRAARSVLEHHHSPLRLVGATHFSRLDPPDLNPLTTLYEDERAVLEVRETALERVLNVVDEEERDRRLIDVLLRPPLVSAALGHCRQHGLPPPDEALGRLVIAGHPDAILYAAELGRRQYEPILVRLLEGDALAPKYPAVMALGKLGTAHAAEALNDLANGILTPARLRRAALDAIDEIKERGGYEAGRLSILDPESGGALAVIEGGEVSLKK